MNTKQDELRQTAANNPELAARITNGPYPYPGEEMYQRIDGYYQFQARQALFEAIGRLKENLYNCIIALYSESISMAEYGRRIKRSRERVRQLEAKALRRLRLHLVTYLVGLRSSFQVVPIPDGPRDPAWIGTRQAARLTNLSMHHIRHLARTGKITSRLHPTLGMRIQVGRQSLKDYVLSQGVKGRRRKGVWRGD